MKKAVLMTKEWKIFWTEYYISNTQREILGFTDQSFFVKIVFTKMLKLSWQSW